LDGLPFVMIHSRVGHRRGFTLLELVIVVAVVIILSGAAAISLPRFRADALLNAATDLQSVLSVTRETAVAMRVPLSVTLNIEDNSVSYTKPGGQPATLQFNGTIGYPGYFVGDGSLDRISAYMNYDTNSGLYIKELDVWTYNRDWYVTSTMKGTSLLQVWFDAFGHPNVQETTLPSGTPGLGSVAFDCGFVTLETKGGGFIVQVLVHMNTGETEILWIKR